MDIVVLASNFGVSTAIALYMVHWVTNKLNGELREIVKTLNEIIKKQERIIEKLEYLSENN